MHNYKTIHMRKFLVSIALIGLSLVAMGSALQHEVDIGQLKQELSYNMESNIQQTGQFAELDYAKGHIESFTILQVAPQPEIVLMKPQSQSNIKYYFDRLQLLNNTLQARFNLYDTPIIILWCEIENANFI